MAVGTGAAIIGGSVLGAVGSAVSGRGASKAAKSAASAQERGAQAGIEEQRRQFDITQGNLQPFQEAGVSALEQQRILLGLGGSSQVDPNAERRAELENQIASITRQSLPGSPALSAQPSALVSHLLGGNEAMRGLGQSIQQPQSQPGQQRSSSQTQSQLEDLQAQLSQIPEFNPEQRGTAQEQQQQAFAAFNESPGQRFIRDRAQRNLTRNASAIGGLGGGNVRSALVEQGAGFAQQDFNNQFGRLGQIAGQGQAATTNLGQFGAQSAGNIANLQQAGSQARASGILGQQQARSNTIGQIAGLGGLALSQFGGGGLTSSGLSNFTGQPIN